MITKTCRYCDVCAAGEDVSITVCEVCCNTGGAYKALDKPGKWIHSLCASWIPEIYSVDVKNEIFLTAKGLDRKRFKLKCVLCSGKGACIQCSYGKCCIPAHPWCVLHTPKGFTRRVIKDEDDEMVWDIFCKAKCQSNTCLFHNYLFMVFEKSRGGILDGKFKRVYSVWTYPFYVLSPFRLSKLYR